MKYYKDTENKLHVLDNVEFLHLLPEGCVEITEEDFAVMSAPPLPTTEQIIVGFTYAIQQRLDDFAKTRGYDNILSAATYATSTVAKFATEGQYAVDGRDATWAKCYDILAAVEAGTRPVPTLDELIAELPALKWP
jgi:hypothetical protein